MAIIELSAGQSHSFANVALRITVTRAARGAGPVAAEVMLQAVDEQGRMLNVVRVSKVEIVAVPRAEKLRLVVKPAQGGSFQAGTNLGLTVLVEGGAAQAQQVVVAPMDVGALIEHEFAVLEYSGGRSTLTVTGRAVAAATEAREPGFVSGSFFEADRTDDHRASPNDALHPWILPGRYAVRDGVHLLSGGNSFAAATGRSWAVALDGSASIRRSGLRSALEPVVELGCGILLECTGGWPVAALVAGVEALAVRGAATAPAQLLDAAIDAEEPPSWCFLAPAARRLANDVGPNGMVLFVCDGVPADVDALAFVIAGVPGVTFALLSLGASPWDLDDDADARWWENEVSGIEQIAALPNVDVVTLRRSADGSPALHGSRAASFAVRLTRRFRAAA